MGRFLYRMALITVAIAAILFGVWYYMRNRDNDEIVHGTLVWNCNR